MFIGMFRCWHVYMLNCSSKIYIPLKIPKYDQLTPPASTLRRRETLGRKNWRHFRELGRQPTNRKGRMFGRASAFSAFRGEYFSGGNIFQGRGFGRASAFTAQFVLPILSYPIIPNSLNLNKSMEYLSAVRSPSHTQTLVLLEIRPFAIYCPPGYNWCYVLATCKTAIWSSEV